MLIGLNQDDCCTQIHTNGTDLALAKPPFCAMMLVQQIFMVVRPVGDS
jgi:hypothetical protein